MLLFDKGQRQIDSGRDPRRRNQLLVPNVDRIMLDLRGGEFCRQFRCILPMRRNSMAVEQSRMAKRESTSANGSVDGGSMRRQP